MGLIFNLSVVKVQMSFDSKPYIILQLCYFVLQLSSLLLVSITHSLQLWQEIWNTTW